MLNPSYDLFVPDFRNKQCATKRDSTYILRMLLFRASNEADRRYYLCIGEKAKEYRRLSYELDEMAGRVEDYLDQSGRIKPVYMAMILEAVVLSRNLILLDQTETRLEYEALLRNLVHAQEDGWSEGIAA